MGFENLDTAVDQSAALAPITPETAKFSDEQLADATAVGLVIADANIAEKLSAQRRSQPSGTPSTISTARR
jgi:hypothetical protein